MTITTAQLNAWPLPYRGGDLNISFPASLGGVPIAVEVVIYDVQGRRVRTIASGTYSSGVQVTTWDGRNALGKPVVTGVYFLKSTSVGLELTQKIVIIR